jgi:hypothetical protein
MWQTTPDPVMDFRQGQFPVSKPFLSFLDNTARHCRVLRETGVFGYVAQEIAC